MTNRTFQAPRGTTDLLPEAQPYWRFVEGAASRAAEAFGYDRIDTPTFEDAGLFVRGVGETTDIVEKETYTFEDRGGDLLSLRPEGTAPVCRAYLEHGMHNRSQPVRLYYICPMYRYDRPQAGRYRELHQFGAEAIGDVDPAVDAEIIELGWSLLKGAGLTGLTLLLNSIGDPACRPAYIDALRAYFESQQVTLQHEDCRRRLQSNPLRLLDCKEEPCQPAIDSAPRSTDYLCGKCADHWQALLGWLGRLGIPYRLESRLARGLDYYTRTVFEIVPEDGGSQGTILGGGRYDGLIEQLGGSPTPGIGFATGIERIILNLQAQAVAAPGSADTKVLVAHVGDEAKEAAFGLSSEMRSRGLAAVLAPSGRSLRAQMRYASSIRATHAVIIGERELESGKLALRDLARSEQQELGRDELLQALAAP